MRLESLTNKLLPLTLEMISKEWPWTSIEPGVVAGWRHSVTTRYSLKVCSLHPPSAASVHLSHAPHAHARNARGVNTKHWIREMVFVIQAQFPTLWSQTLKSCFSWMLLLTGHSKKTQDFLDIIRIRFHIMNSNFDNFGWSWKFGLYNYFIPPINQWRKLH